MSGRVSKEIRREASQILNPIEQQVIGIVDRKLRQIDAAVSAKVDAATTKALKRVAEVTTWQTRLRPFILTGAVSVGVSAAVTVVLILTLGR